MGADARVIVRPERCVSEHPCRPTALEMCIRDPARSDCLVSSFKLHAQDLTAEWKVRGSDNELLTREQILTDFLNVRRDHQPQITMGVLTTSSHIVCNPESTEAVS